MSDRVKDSNCFLKKFRAGGDQFLDRIITTDGTWFHYYDPETKHQSSQWKHAHSPAPKKTKVTKSMGKHMFIVFMDRNGMILTHAVPQGQTVNADYYSKVSKRFIVINEVGGGRSRMNNNYFHIFLLKLHVISVQSDTNNCTYCLNNYNKIHLCKL